MHKQERERLIKHLDFLREELEDFPKFRVLDQKTYSADKDTRRNVERWVENLVSCCIDIAKIVLATQKRRIPETYREVLFDLGNLPSFSEALGEELSRWARLRNILAHEYLDVRWASIRAFIDKAEPVLQEFAGRIEALLHTES